MDVSDSNASDASDAPDARHCTKRKRKEEKKKKTARVMPSRKRSRVTHPAARVTRSVATARTISGVCVQTRTSTNDAVPFDVLPPDVKSIVTSYLIDDPLLFNIVRHEPPTCFSIVDIQNGLFNFLNIRVQDITNTDLLYHLQMFANFADDPTGLLIYASEYGLVRIVSWCLATHISENSKGHALQPASENGHLPVVDFALGSASWNGHDLVVKLLLHAGANVHVDDDLALRWASSNGHHLVVELLLQAGANVRVHDDYALRWASWNGHDLVVKLLLQAGANVHAYDDDALRLASENGHPLVVELLLRAGADAQAGDDAA